MEKEEGNYLRELIEYFIKNHNIPEEDLGEIFHYCSIIYLNTPLINKEQFSHLVNLFVSTNPKEPLSKKEIITLKTISEEMAEEGNSEDVPFKFPDVEYLENKEDARVFLSANRQRYVFSLEKGTVKITDIVSKKPLAEGGINLLFKRW